MIGHPPMPWQGHVADVALEVDPDTGLLVYREVVLTVPRQSGKTTLILGASVHRAQGFGRRQRILYAAQTRNHARQKWEEEHVATLKASPLKSLFRVRLSNGSEAIRWKNGSTHGITAATEKSGHGDTLDLGVIDESFAHEDARLEQGMRPTMITRPQPQIWVVSTAGTAKSVYLRGKVDAGRKRVELGASSSVAYFEWSAPKEADPEDPATWLACMPALCPVGPPCRCDPAGRWRHTVFVPTIRDELEGMDLSEFRRAYLNQWPDDIPDGWQVIGQASWEALADSRSRMADPIAIAADVTPERSYGSIAAYGLRGDGLGHAEIVEHRPGTGWMVERIVEIVLRWRPCRLVIDAAGPAGSLIAPLRRALEKKGIDLEVTLPTARDATQACGDFYDAVMDTASLRHLDQEPLNTALEGALKRPLGDSWAWARKGLSVVISPLVAVTLAKWGYETRPAEEKTVLTGSLMA
jgi:hypothetical protein